MKSLSCLLLAVLTAGALLARPFTVVVYNGEHLFDVDGVSGFEEYQASKYTPAHALTKFRNAARVLAKFENGRGADIIILSELEADLTPGKEVLDYEKLLARYTGMRLADMLGAKFDPQVADLPSELLLAKAMVDEGLTGYRIAASNDSGFAQNGRRIEHKNGVFTRFPIKATRVHPTTDARSILEVQLEVDGALLYVFSNHWKSGASDPATEAARVANARTLRTRIDEILRVDPNADILIGGDLNSQYNHKQRYPQMKETGLNDVLRSQGNESAVLGTQRDLYNLWYELPAPERGSDTFRGEWGTLIHLIISRGLYDHRGVQYVDNSFGVAKFPGLNADASGLPRRWSFDGPAGSGCSDHFPVFAKFITVTDDRADRYLPLRNPSVEDPGAPMVTKIGYDNVDLAAAAVHGSSIPAGTSIRSETYKGKIFRVEGRVAKGSRLAVEYRGETYDVWSFNEALRNKLRAEHPEGAIIRFYGELGVYRDRWQFVIPDPSWVK